MVKSNKNHNLRKLIGIISLVIILPQTIGVIFNSHATTTQYDNMIDSDLLLNSVTASNHYSSMANNNLLDITTDILLSDDPINISRESYNPQLNLAKEYIERAKKEISYHNNLSKDWSESRKIAIAYIGLADLVNRIVFSITFTGLIIVLPIPKF